MNTRTAAFDNDLIHDEKPIYEESPSGFSVDGVMQSIRNFATLSEMLRILGATVFVLVLQDAQKTDRVTDQKVAIVLIRKMA